MADGLANKLAGKFIVFDGPDGCGKTTQRERCQAFLVEQGIEVVAARDPGGTDIGDKIRHILLSDDLHEMDVRCETFLFMASLSLPASIICVFFSSTASIAHLCGYLMSMAQVKI